MRSVLELLIAQVPVVNLCVFGAEGIMVAVGRASARSRLIIQAQI